MPDAAASSRPLGWWLKEADGRLEAAFEHSLPAGSVSRRGWQVLASLGLEPAGRSELIASLASFDPPVAVEGVVADLVERGLVEDDDGLLRLTAAGHEHRASLTPAVESVRARVGEALSPEDYGTLVQLLERLVRGLAPR